MPSIVLMHPKKRIMGTSNLIITLAASTFYDATRSSICSLVASINIARAKWRNSRQKYLMAEMLQIM